MTVQGTQFLQPRSADPVALYQALKTLIDALNRQSASGGTLTPAVQSAVDGIQTQINNLVTNGDLTPQQAFELSLQTRADQIFGSFTDAFSRQQNERERAADAAIAAAISANTANTGVKTEVQVRAQADLSLAQQINTVSAALGVTNSNVTTLTQAVSDGDTALATQINSLSSTVAGNTASINILTSSVNGIETHYAITLNAQNEITGFFKLDGTQTGTSATFNVDNFFIGKAGTSGGNAINIFAISTVGGVPQIALRGQIIADGSISARTIAAGAVTADKITAATLSAISANLGTVTAGFMQNPAGTLLFDLANMRMYTSDGKVDFNLAGRYLVMQS